MISEPIRIDKGWAVIITRKNNTTYRATSEDYQSIVDYRNEFLASMQRRKVR